MSAVFAAYFALVGDVPCVGVVEHCYAFRVALVCACADARGNGVVLVS